MQTNNEHFEFIFKTYKVFKHKKKIANVFLDIQAFF